MFGQYGECLIAENGRRALTSFDRLDTRAQCSNKPALRVADLAVSSLFRELKARPSGSRTVGIGTMVTGILKSRIMRRMMASCCASFSPKYARSG